MKPHKTLLLLLASMALMAGPALRAADAEGTITGRIVNAATGDYLAGASVELVGTSISSVTEADGSFRLLHVPAGMREVRAQYTGLNPETRSILVAPRQTAEVAAIRLTADIYQMEKVVVGGLREGNAAAITVQRNADNIKNVVAADTFGNISDGNPGDLLQYLPGVSADYVGNEVRTIQIRGMAPEMGAVTMDGTRLASSQSANLGRQFEYETASLGNIEAVELNKVLLPDMEADAVSGSVNLRTKSALDGSPDRRIAFNFGMTLDPQYNVPGYSDHGVAGSLRYSEVLGARRNFGIVFSSSYHKTDSPAFQFNKRYQTTTSSPAYTFQVIGPRPAPGPRQRISNNLKFEYAFNPRTRVDVRFGYNTMLETSHPREFTLTAANSVATLDAAGNPTGTGGILPGYSDLLTQTRQLATTTASFLVQRFPKRGRTFILGSGGRFRGEGLELTWNGSYSYSQTRYHRTALLASEPNIAWRLVRTDVDDRYPEYVQTAGADMYNLANYSGFRYQRTDQNGYDSIFTLRADLKKDFASVLPSYVKTGVNYRSQTRDIDRKYWDYAYTGTQPLTRFLDQHWDYNRLLQGYRSPPFPGIDEATAVYDANPSDFTRDIASSLSTQFLNNKRATEDVGAAYAMGGVGFGKLKVIGGLRIERTEDEATGPKRQLTAAETARRAAFVGPLTPAEIERRTIAEYGSRQSAKADYTDLFPSLHLKYNFVPGLMARASFATGIGRPGFADIIPTLTINEAAGTITATNSGLKPEHSRNLEFSLEYYFEPVGVFSIGYFHKRITDFIFSDTDVVSTGAGNGFDGQYAGYVLSTSANGGYGIVKGYEINYSQQLSKLPGLLSRLGVYANYTRNNTEGNYGSGGATVQSTNQIVGFIPETANAGVSFIHGRLDLRMQWNWRGQYLVAYSANAASLRWEEGRSLVNLRTKIRVYRNYAVYFDALNVFNTPVGNQYIFAPSRNFTYNTGSPRYYFGISGTF